ncbi:hypothetical protein [Rhodobacter sp. NSM]|uniref:hypothetical protein n=1 Tax=Rhodobacter sp. NSM TaxID=3457501 RepID=UPI003FCF9F57
MSLQRFHRVIAGPDSIPSARERESRASALEGGLADLNPAFSSSKIYVEAALLPKAARELAVAVEMPPHPLARQDTAIVRAVQRAALGSCGAGRIILQAGADTLGVPRQEIIYASRDVEPRDQPS